MSDEKSHKFDGNYETHRGDLVLCRACGLPASDKTHAGYPRRPYSAAHDVTGPIGGERTFRERLEDEPKPMLRTLTQEGILRELALLDIAERIHDETTKALRERAEKAEVEVAEWNFMANSRAHRPRTTLPDARRPRGAEAVRILFGKHKGELVENLPTEYLEWCLENLDEERNKGLLREMQDQLALRRGEGVQRQKGRLG